MLKVAVHGAAGRMGRSIIEVLRGDSNASLVAAMDAEGTPSIGRDAGQVAGGDPLGVIVCDDLESFLSNSDVVIDFSLPEATAKLLPLCAAQQIPLVIGTTGIDSEVQTVLQRSSEQVPLVYAPNYSQGVTALFHLAGLATKLLGSDFDAEIVESHHRHKVDAPSGTAVELSRVVAAAKDLELERAAKHGRSGQVGEREKNEIGVMSLRGGDVVGEHTLHLIGEGERVELTHRATDRGIFARGAVRAAHWVCQQNPGLYDMSHVMGA